MRKFFNKVYILAIILFCVLLTACQTTNEEPQEEPKNELQVQVLEEPSETSQVSEESQEQMEMIIEHQELEGPIKEVPCSSFKLPDDVFIIEVSQTYDGNQQALTLKDNLLQFWVNDNMVCEKQIPVPAKISLGSNFYEVIGNPYISTDNQLILIQSYTTSSGQRKLDYTVLTNNCIRIIPSLNYDGYVFQNFEGNYGLASYRDASPLPWYPYEGFGFNIADSNFTLPKPTIIWLNESTVKSVNFGSWGSSSYGYQDVSAISVRLNVESYGELDIARVGDSFEPVEVDYVFLDLLREKFLPEEYTERFNKVIQTLSEYKEKS